MYPVFNEDSLQDKFLMIMYLWILWMYMYAGYESEGVWKPVPGKALLPVLESPPSTPTPTRLTPTPPRTQPPSDATRPSRMLRNMGFSFSISL